MRVRHSIAYERLASLAAQEAGLPGSVAQDDIAADEGARALRDSYWLDYERRLRDDKAYTLENIVEWFVELDLPLSTSCVHRDRTALYKAERALKLRAGLAKAMVDSAAGEGQGDVLKAARILAGQQIFKALNELDIDPDDLTPTHVINLIGVLGTLSKQHVETDLLAARLAEASKAAKQQVDKAAVAAGAKGLSRQDVYKILDDVMKGAA